MYPCITEIFIIMKLFDIVSDFLLRLKKIRKEVLKHALLEGGLAERSGFLVQ